MCSELTEPLLRLKTTSLGLRPNALSVTLPKALELSAEVPMDDWSFKGPGLTPEFLSKVDDAPPRRLRPAEGDF